MNTAENREHKRLSVEFTARLSFGNDVHSVTLHNLSVGGASVVHHSSWNPKAGESFNLEITDENLPALGATVVWVSDQHTGIKFNLSSEQVSQLKTWLATLNRVSA